MRLISENRDEYVAGVDYGPAIREAVKLYETGREHISIQLPSGRKLSARAIVRLYELEEVVERR